MRFLPLASFAAVAFACVPNVIAGSQPITVVLQFENPASSVSQSVMKSEVRRLLSTAAEIRFENGRTQNGSAVAGRLVLFQMSGSCDMNGPAIGKVSSHLALGSTNVSDGAVLPFGRVDCDRIRLSLQRILDSSNVARYQHELGLAMGRVLAHELYHIISGSRSHTARGITKSELSAVELVANTSNLPLAALNETSDDQRIR